MTLEIHSIEYGFKHFKKKTKFLADLRHDVNTTCDRRNDMTCQSEKGEKTNLWVSLGENILLEM